MLYGGVGTTKIQLIVFVPNTNKVISLSKAIVSMARNEKTRNQTKEGETPKKKEYLVIMDL